MTQAPELPPLHAGVKYRIGPHDLEVSFATTSTNCTRDRVKYTLGGRQVTITFFIGSDEICLLEVPRLLNISPEMRYLIYDLVGADTAEMIDRLVDSASPQFSWGHDLDPDESHRLRVTWGRIGRLLGHI